MIQRIQTVYLLLASVAALLLMFLPIGLIQPVAGMTALPDGATMEEDNLSLIKVFAKNYLPLMIGALAMVSISLLTIFFYTNRSLQMKTGWFSIVLGLAFAGVFVGLFSDKLDAFKPVVGAILVPVYLILCFLAIRGVKADQRLIKSSERFR